ncbi:hypothetical protein HY218_00575, partial [Candidatus Saccharibacteria bacterium]|nr:hypothetical protein [Candidatus Saccharibacteria bacterium]
HQFTSKTKPRRSDLFTPKPGEKTTVEASRRDVITKYGLDKLGYTTVPVKTTTAA